MENYNELDAKRKACYKALASRDGFIAEILGSYGKIIGNYNMFARLPDDLPPLIANKAAELCRQFYERAKDSPEYAELVRIEKEISRLPKGARKPVIRQQGASGGSSPQSAGMSQSFGESISNFDNSQRIQGMLIEEDDPFASDDEDENIPDNRPVNGMIAEDDDDSLLFDRNETPVPVDEPLAAAKSEDRPKRSPGQHVSNINEVEFNPLGDGLKKVERPVNSNWESLNNLDGPADNFQPENELPDYDISKPVGVIDYDLEKEKSARVKTDKRSAFVEEEDFPSASIQRDKSVYKTGDNENSHVNLNEDFAFGTREENAMEISAPEPVPGKAREISSEKIAKASRHINEVYYEHDGEKDSVPVRESAPVNEHSDNFPPLEREENEADDADNPFAVRYDESARQKHAEVLADSDGSDFEEPQEEDPFEIKNPRMENVQSVSENKPEPVEENPDDENDSIVNDADMSSYFQHMENRKAEKQKLREQDETRYVDGKLQRDASYSESVQSEDAGPELKSYMGRMVSQEEYEKLVAAEIESAGKGDDNFEPTESFSEKFVPQNIASEHEQPEDPDIEQPDEPDLGQADDPDFEPHGNEALPGEPEEFEKPVSGARNSAPSQNQTRAEELGRQIHNEDDPFKNNNLSSEVEDAIEKGSCLDDMNDFADVFHNTDSNEKKKDENSSGGKGLFNNFSFNNLFNKITGSGK